MAGVFITIDVDPTGGSIQGFTPPVDADWRYLNFFDNSSDALTRNLADGMPGATVVGSPVRSTLSATFKTGFNYLETLVTQSAEQTTIIVARPIALATGFLVSNFMSSRLNGEAGKTAGYSVWFPPGETAGTVTAQIIIGRKETTGGPTYTTPGNLPAFSISGAPFNCYLARYSASTGEQSLWNMTTGAKSDVTLGINPDPGADGLRIGSNNNPPYDASTSGSSEVAALWDSSNWLSDADAMRAYRWMQSYYSRRGVTI